MGRPLRVRIHLGIYVLQQLFNLTDRAAEAALNDNAAFRLFCGYGILKKWHTPDHTKIETFRSKLTAETQRRLANLICQQAVLLGYAHPEEMDVDSTVQEANIAYPSLVNLLFKVAILGATVARGLNQLCHQGKVIYQVGLSHLKQLCLYYFRLKRQNESQAILLVVLKQLWCAVYENVLPLLNNAYRLQTKISQGKHWMLRRAMETLCWRVALLLENTHAYLFEGVINKPMNSLHAYEVACFNKGKLNNRLEFGRAYQLGRLGGNFMIVGRCSSIHMPDAQSLPAMVRLHQDLFGQNTLQSIATDKGYYSFDNVVYLKAAAVKDVYLPRPERTLNAPADQTAPAVRQLLHDRRSGIEPLIGHVKHGGQMGKSRVKSDETTKSTGYAAVFGFNLRQLTRYLAGEVRSKTEETTKILAHSVGNDAIIIEGEVCMA